MILFLQHWKLKSIQLRICFRLAGYLGSGIVADLVTLSKDHTRNTMPTGTKMILYLRIGNLKKLPYPAAQTYVRQYMGVPSPQECATLNETLFQYFVVVPVLHCKEGALH